MVYVNYLGVGSEGRALTESQSEVEPLAKEHDEIGLGEDLGECAEARVVSPARTLHANDGDARSSR